LFTGALDKEPHVVLTIAHPENKNLAYIADMTSMQYGKAGRGAFGENYFLGTWSQFWDEHIKGVCEDATFSRCAPKARIFPKDEKRLMGCAKRVMERWLNREKEGWCEHCGKPGKELLRCGGCRDKKVWYCCKEHQRAGWKLHKHTCEKKEA
jgi:hypothetical protein